MSSSTFFRLPCGILHKVSAWMEMFFEAADLKLHSETIHFDMLKRRRSAIRDSLREHAEGQFAVVDSYTQWKL